MLSIIEKLKKGMAVFLLVSILSVNCVSSYEYKHFVFILCESILLTIGENFFVDKKGIG